MTVNRVLLVEDQESVAKVTKLLLKSRYGLDVDHAWNYREAIELYRSNGRDYRVLILDVTFPGEDGKMGMNGMKLARDLYNMRGSYDGMMFFTGEELDTEETGIPVFQKPIQRNELFEKVQEYFK